MIESLNERHFLFQHRQRQWERFTDLVTELTIPDKQRYLNPVLGFVTESQIVTWTASAILAMFFYLTTWLPLCLCTDCNEGTSNIYGMTQQLLAVT